MFEQELYSKKSLSSEGHQTLYALWAARFCSYKPFSDRFINDRLNHSEVRDLAELLHFNVDSENEGFAQKLLSHAKQLEKSLSNLNPSFNGAIEHNLKNLKNTIGLSDVDNHLLGFYVLLKSNSNFENVMDSINNLNRQKLVDVLSLVLNIPKKSILIALDRQGMLTQSGLLRIDNRNNSIVSCKVDLLDGLQDVLTSQISDPIELFSRYFNAPIPPTLSLDNFPHLQEESQRIIHYLQNQKSRKGTNILVYGAPGTGKTEWVKAIAKSLQFPIFEITTQDDDGDTLREGQRVEMYKLAQYSLQNGTQNLVMFDEVEDVFPSNDFAFFLSKRSRSSNKGWMNKLLEENPVPTFWISNEIRQIDPAYIRRFDLVIEVDTPPRNVRYKIISDALKGVDVSQKWIELLADQKQLVPAVISRSAKVVTAITKPNDSQQTIQNHLVKLINATIEAQGNPPLELNVHAGSFDYSLDFINTDLDIKQLVEGVKRSQRGRFCLYGLPGTGKTAFGNHLAKALGKTLIIKRASDLLSPYVGEAEQNIALAFKEAKREGAVLQIDEADSFLQSRENAVRSWEVTQVNELLTQMESFEGVFIASTNLMGNIDQAAMRRFDLKLEFKPLTNHQAFKMIDQILLQHNMPNDNKTGLLAQLNKLNVLTPGDFSAVMRKIEISGQIPEVDILISALEQECQFKPSYRKTNGIGFLTTLSH